MIYLDNAASTRAREEVISEITDMLLNSYANPDAIHTFGLEINQKIKRSRQIIANIMGVDSKNVYFTSGGSEGNNIIIQGIIDDNSREKNI